MTNEELIQAFPECEKVKRDDMRQCIIDAIEQENFYCEASRKVYNKAHDLWPYKREWRDGDTEYEDYKLYFWGDWHDVKSPFDEWLRCKFEEEFIERHGQAHTFDEACQMAADEWTRMIFGNHVQNNGDQSDAGGMSMILGTLAKDRASQDIDSKTIEEFRQLCKEFYLGGCVYETKYGKVKDWPYCDYHPNEPLADLLVKAGVPSDRIGSICPWKTGITINERDNAVRIGGYQTERFI